MSTPGQVNFARAMAYIEKVKDRLKDRPELYAQFLQTMTEHNERRQAGTGMEDSETVGSTRAKLEVLFKDDPDLLEEFEIFVPEEYRKPTAQTAAA